MSGLIDLFKKKKSKNLEENQNFNDENIKEKNTSKKQLILNIVNETSKKMSGLFYSTQPKIYSMSFENNIACKLDENFIITKDENLCMGFKIDGFSYAASSPNEEIDLATLRKQFFNRLKDNIEITIICQKEIISIHNNNSTFTNPYAKEIVDKWDSDSHAYKTSYYILVSTKNKALVGVFQGLKDKATTEKEEEDEKKKQKIKYDIKLSIMKELRTNLLNDLVSFKPKQLSSDELINIFASYANAQKTNLKYSYELITDCYISSDVEFKKDHIIFYKNDGTQSFARFVSIKAYETDNITSLITTSILRENTEFVIFLSCQALSKDAAIKKVKDIRAISVDFIREELEILIELLKGDRESIIETSYSVFIKENSLAELNEKTDIIKGLLENQGLVAVKESINQQPLFFSFFPSRANLNARKRTIKSDNLASLITFENDILGFPKNQWGDNPVTIFKHITGSPFLFNFHDSMNEGASGHTLIVGGTGYGKTTLMQFLMLNLHRYNINILGLDKLRGMYNFANFLGEEYHDMGDMGFENTNLKDENKFRLNPFSLANTNENNSFLNMWLCKMGEIQDNEIELQDIVSQTISALRFVETHNPEHVSKLRDFFESLPIPNTPEDLKLRFRKYLDSLFDNKEDALNFQHQMSIINMDAILKDPKLASLSALYLFHKMKNIAKNSAKGFFIFIDELKDYLNDVNMRESIVEAIVEVRKINGVMALGVQNLDFFEDMPKADTLLSSMANFIIFPTSNEKSLARMEEQLNLSDSELDFLHKTPKESRLILFKQNNLNASAVLDVNLSRLGEYLRVFSSNATDVKALNTLRKHYQNPNEWRARYLKNIK